MTGTVEAGNPAAAPRTPAAPVPARGVLLPRTAARSADEDQERIGVPRVPAFVSE